MNVCSSKCQGNVVRVSNWTHSVSKFCNESVICLHRSHTASACICQTITRHRVALVILYCFAKSLRFQKQWHGDRCKCSINKSQQRHVAGVVVFWPILKCHDSKPRTNTPTIPCLNKTQQSVQCVAFSGGCAVCARTRACACARASASACACVPVRVSACARGWVCVCLLHSAS